MDYQLDKTAEPITYKYHFKLSSGDEKLFEIKLDGSTLECIRNPQETAPDWTELACEKCPNCPLNETENKYCPVAQNSVDMIEFFSTLQSVEKIHLKVETEQRNYSKDTDLQSALGSLLGVYMVTSGCPIMDKLRPMARFHLPFASPEETMYRTISMYLLGQYFLYKKNEDPDWELKDLNKIYADIGAVNKAFLARLKKTTKEDATLNALIKLDNFKQYVDMSVTDQDLEEIECLFEAYFKED